MGITANFLKLRSSGTPQLGEWNINYDKVLALAKKNSKYIVTCWSNGDKCGYCTAAETCMMQAVFKDWIKKQDAYFVFQYSGDKDKGKMLHDWIYGEKKIKSYPGFRITLYDANGNIALDNTIEGNKLRSNKGGVNGAKAMVENLAKIFAEKPDAPSEDIPQDETDYKIRLNEKLTVAQVNKILDAIDDCAGYCPCQVRDVGTKCHCEDFVKNKGLGEPCICNIYVKQAK